MSDVVDFSLRYNLMLDLQQEHKEYLIAQSCSVLSSLHCAWIQAQQRVTIPCSNSRDEALNVSFRRGNKRHSHRVCDETTEQGKRKVLIRDSVQHFLCYIICHFLWYNTLHRQFCWFPIPPSILKNCLSCLYGSRDKLKAGFKHKALQRPWNFYRDL